MKKLVGCFILSNGSLLVGERPCLKSFSRQDLLISDSINHPTWSGRAVELKTEVSKFINKFSVNKE